jgi:ABC-type transport system involved in multi-copper enzyme maturation permease subunit
MMLAFMLSVITRNTAASVGISIAVYFGGNLANTFISLFATGEWAKFIPFNNMSLASRLFPDPMGSFGMNIFGYQSVVPSITFSAVYLAVLVICMGYIALDSFNRRDIK